MSKLIYLASQYELLDSLFAHIRKSDAVFERLKQVNICDGRGLQTRQEYRGLHSLLTDPSESATSWYRAVYDEEIEVRVWNLRCDATNALPCLRCGVNVCEECRYLPRAQDTLESRSDARPHLDPTYTCHMIMCHCKKCDREVERNLPLRFSDTCDCNQYTRWICIPCKMKEDQEGIDYFTWRTKLDEDSGMGLSVKGIWIQDHAFLRAFWCPCGKRAREDANVRCAWCLRKHRLPLYVGEDNSFHTPFETDPCYPSWNTENSPIAEGQYPDLGYTGPIAP